VTENLFNVLHQPRAGQLDPRNNPAHTEADLIAIRGYVSAYRNGRSAVTSATGPAIARPVLEKYWQYPRCGFNAGAKQELDSGFTLGGKLLLIPWSEEAFVRANAQRSTTGLILEHVTPITCLWDELIRIDEASEDDAEWQGEAGKYLQETFLLAVITADQDAILNATGWKQAGVPRPLNPFLRYEWASQQIQTASTPTGLKAPAPAALDVARFVHPGPALRLQEQELLDKDEV